MFKKSIIYIKTCSLIFALMLGFNLNASAGTYNPSCRWHLENLNLNQLAAQAFNNTDNLKPENFNFNNGRNLRSERDILVDSEKYETYRFAGSYLDSLNSIQFRQVSLQITVVQTTCEVNTALLFY